MDRDTSSRSELLKTLEAKTEQLHRYESRLRDVVHAYKGVIKEKEALEATVKVLSAAPQQSSGIRKSTHGAPGQAGDPESFADPLSAQVEPEGRNEEEDISLLREKVATLSSSIATLSEEKSRLEAGYMAEKKKLRHDNEELQMKLDAHKENSVKIEHERSSEILQLKNKIRSQQHEREKEQTDHAVMLRELQKLLAQERIAKEQLEHQLDEVNERLRLRENQPDVAEQYEKRIHDLSNELQLVRHRMKAAEVKADEPSPFVLELQREMAEMKAQYRIQVVQEQKRANDAEDRLRDAGEQGEQRVSGLEDKLSELSEVVGNYERLRYQDQQSILKLRERVTQLELENSALVQAVHQPEKDADSANEENLDAQALANKIVHLKALLKLANDRSEKPVDIEEVFGAGGSQCEACHQYQDDLKAVKEEFERYKLRAQSVLKNKARDPSSTKVEDTLREQVNELKDKVKTLRLQCDDCEDKQKVRVDELTKAMVSLQQRNKHDLEQVMTEHKQDLSELEYQLKKQRERTVALLAEKDREVEQLRASGVGRLGPEYTSTLPPVTKETEAPEPALTRSVSEEEEALSKLLQKPALLQGETNLLHFVQEQARRDVEIAGLRKTKRQLENALRELQGSSSLKEEKYQEKIDSLTESIRQHERYKSREGANLEYLKNVTFRFLTSNNSHAKQQMFNAIATILQFSPKEKTKVEHYMKSWWTT